MTAALSQFHLHHFSISVPDIEVAIAWYSAIFGFEVEQRFEISAIPAKGSFLKCGELRLELWQVIPGARAPEERKIPDSDLHSGGTKHVAFAVENLQRCLEDLMEHGVDIAAVQRSRGQPMRPDPEPALAGKTPAFAAFIRDPGGTLIELLDAGQLAASATPTR